MIVEDSAVDVAETGQFFDDDVDVLIEGYAFPVRNRSSCAHARLGQVNDQLQISS